MYSVSTAKPEIFVDVISNGRGIDPALLPLRNKLRLRRLEVANDIGSHSRTIEVWVAFRQRRIGAEGSWDPNVERMED